MRFIVEKVTDTTMAANQSTFTAVGKFPETINLGNLSASTHVRVLQEMQGTPPILKKSTCQALRIIPQCFRTQLPESLSSTTSLTHACNSTAAVASKETLLSEFADVFDGRVTSMKDETFKIHLEPNAVPFSVTTPRRIPLPLMNNLRKELQNLQDLGIIRPVTEPTPWCAAIVVAPKKDPGQIRLCVDFRALNKYVRRERYQSPTPHELVMRSDMQNAQYFTVVDALKGYHQIPIAVDDQLLTTFITPFGRFCYIKSPFGISSISEHYNRRMDEALHGLPRIVHLVDDCLIVPQNKAQHEEDVRRFLHRCRDQGIALNGTKFVYAQEKVTFAGLQLTRNGSTIDPQLLQAIRDFPTPTNRTDIKSFFGLINQLSPFTDKIAEVSKPLRPLLKQSVQFQWDTSHQESFDQARHALANSDYVVAYYDPKKPTALHTDASRLKGLGFILRQQSQDGSWRVTQAGSRFLSNAETRCAMIELELLAISWAAQKCPLFLEGLPQFEIIIKKWMNSYVQHCKVKLADL